MGHGITKITFDDSVLPTGADNIELLNTAIACTGKRQLNGVGGAMKRFVWNIVFDAAATIRLDKSDDRGVTWVTVGAAVTPVTGVDGGFLIEHYDDFRIVWVNGGAGNQTVWEVDIALDGERSVAGVAGDA